MTSQLFIAGDWGTTQLRLFLCDRDTVIAARVGRGIGALDELPETEFGKVAQAWLAEHRIARAVLAGMVGSRNGWLETDYVACPAAITDLPACFRRIRHDDMDIDIVPGLSCTSPSGAADVMRGEETQVFGALVLERKLAHGRHVLALPGTHTKWVLLDSGRVIHFQTALTGELFALLRTHSTLLKAAPASVTKFDDASFERGLIETNEIPLPLRLFQVRSRQLIDGLSPEQASGLLSGLLLGADVDGAVKLFSPEIVTLVCEPMLAARYARALRSRGIESQHLDGNDCVLAGLRALAGYPRWPDTNDA